MNKNIVRRCSSLMLVAGVSFQLALPALADGSVKLGGTSVFTVNAGSGNMTADARAASMQRNMDNALVATSNRTPTAVAVSYVNGQPVLTLGGFYVGTVDVASAKKVGTTPSVLASRWAAGLKKALTNHSLVESYVAQLSGSPSVAQSGTTETQAGSFAYYKQGHAVFVPAGMTLPVTLDTPLTSETAKAGDKIEATLAETVNLGDCEIPAHSMLIGQVTDAAAGARLGKSGTLGLKFNRLRTPDGAETTIQAHIIGGITKYGEVAANTGIYKGETTSTKVEKAALHGAVGAGAGAILGTTIGAIAGGGRGAGRGAIGGIAIGAGLGVAESLLLRKGNDVQMTSGQTLKLELDAPATIAVTGGNL